MNELLGKLLKQNEVIRSKGANHYWRTYAFAQAVIGLIMGSDWMGLHVANKTAPTDYFRNSAGTHQRQDEHASRIVHFAELLLNLSVVPGFNSIIRMLESRDPEAVVAELETAEIIARAALSFRFVVESGKLGEDYDIECYIDGETVAVDTKCKLESTSPSQSTLIKAFRRVSRQMPKNKPGIIVMKIGSTWFDPLDFDGANALFKQATARFFGQHRGTITCIYFVARHTLPFGRDQVSTFTFKNERHQFPELKIDWDKLLHEGQVGWWSISSLSR